MVSVESSKQSNDTPGGMASPVDPVASMSQRCAHNAGGAIAVGVLLKWLPHPSYVLTGPLLFSAARVSLRLSCASNMCKPVPGCRLVQDTVA